MVEAVRDGRTGHDEVGDRARLHGPERDVAGAREVFALEIGRGKDLDDLRASLDQPLDPGGVDAIHAPRFPPGCTAKRSGPRPPPSRWGTNGVMTELIRDNPSESRYEVVLDGEIVGRAEYVLRGDTVVFTHTEIDAASRHRFGGETRRGRARRCAADGRSVEARCRYVRRFIDRNPAYADLLAA